MGVVAGSLQHFVDELQHRGDAGAARDHVHLLHVHHLRRILAQLLDGELAVAQVLQLAGRSAEGDFIAQLEVVQMLRHLAAVGELRVDVLSVHFHNQIDKAFVIVGRHGRVGADDELAVDGGRQVDVLADGQAKDVLFGRQAEPVLPRVVRDFLLLDQRQQIFLVRVLQRLRWARRLLHARLFLLLALIVLFLVFVHLLGLEQLVQQHGNHQRDEAGG